MSLMFLTEVDYVGVPDMEVGEVYESDREKVNYYGIPMLMFPGWYGWRPKCCFVFFEPDVEMIYNEEGELISIECPVEWPNLD